MRIIAIDPGPEQSAVIDLRYPEMEIVRHFKDANDCIAFLLCGWPKEIPAALVIEQIASYGMAVGEEVFETCFWSGRFAEAWAIKGGKTERIKRHEVKMHLCHDSRAKDGNIRQAIIDRYGGKEKAIGRKKTPGPLYGIKADEWSALAVALTYADRLNSKG